LCWLIVSRIKFVLIYGILGGQFGAIRYSVIFAVVGTTADFTILKLKDGWRDYSKTVYQDIENLKKNENWLRLPEWFPIKVLDEEELAAKRAQEEQFLAQRARIRSLRDKEDSWEDWGQAASHILKHFVYPISYFFSL